jgi:hypothetical protein
VQTPAAKQLVGLFGTSMGTVSGTVSHATGMMAEAATALQWADTDAEEGVKEALRSNSDAAASTEAAVTAAEDLAAAMAGIARQGESFLAAINTLAVHQEVLVHSVDLAAEILTPAGPVPGRIHEMSTAFALFSGPLMVEVVSDLDLRVDGFDRELRTRVIGRRNGCVRLQLPLSHEHRAYVESTLAALQTGGSKAPRRHVA